MTDKKEVSVEEKLRALYDLQLIDSKLDAMRLMRGELPLEVRDLEDDIAAFEVRIKKQKDAIEQLEHEISNKKKEIDEAKSKIQKYTKQQDKVRNNREFDSLKKEIEFEELEVQLSEKKIKEAKAKIEQKNLIINETVERLDSKKEHLGHKKSELDEIIKETEKEELEMLKKSDEYSELIDAHLLKAYKRIRSNVKNGMAVVHLERGAAGGSYFTIPPQKQLEIASRKRVVIDENSGRILVDAKLAEEEEKKINALFS
jgi:predicted  nucleic acid-binding Zn-ribbon protein